MCDPFRKVAQPGSRLVSPLLPSSAISALSFRHCISPLYSSPFVNPYRRSLARPHEPPATSRTPTSPHLTIDHLEERRRETSVAARTIVSPFRPSPLAVHISNTAAWPKTPQPRRSKSSSCSSVRPRPRVSFQPSPTDMCIRVQSVR